MVWGVPGIIWASVSQSEDLALSFGRTTKLGVSVGAAQPRSGSERLRALMDAHFDFVWRSLRRLGLSAADADDAAQEVFLVVSRKLDAIEVLREKRFLFATALRVASSARRSVKRRREDPQASFEDGEYSAQANPEQQLERDQARQQLQSILDAMDLEQRAVFILYELEQLTVPEIAATLTVPIGTVSSRLRAARERFSSIARRLQAQGHTAGGVK
jgi:RNA polymerase sigma-70 factor, ECF subfamily